MNKHLLNFILLPTILFGVQGFAQGAPTEGGQIYKELYSSNLMENYMIDIIDDVTHELTKVAKLWDEYQINGRYRSGWLNIYLVNSSVFPERNPIKNYYLDLSRENIKGNALVDEKNKIIYLDTVLLKELVICSILWSEDRLKMLHAVGLVRLNGLGKYKSLWDPAYNPGLINRDYSQSWDKLFRGSVACLIGHEMGHIAIGKPSFTEKKSPIPYSNKARDLHWACPELVSPYYRQMRSLEIRVDSYYVKLTANIIYPGSVKYQPYLWYEYGAHFLMNYYLNNELINAIYVTESQLIHNQMRIKLGPQLYDALYYQGAHTDEGSVRLFFHKTHPSTVERMIVSLGELSKSNYSSFRGDPTAPDALLLNNIVSRVCREMKQKYGLQ